MWWEEKKPMIHVTHLNHSSFILNCDLIEQIESTPDTVITLTNNQKLIVLETTDEIVERIRLYRRSVFLQRCGADDAPELTRKSSDRNCHG